MSTESQRLAAFVARASYDDLSDSARAQFKIRVLDALGCAFGAIGGGGAASDRAAFYNGALVRYLDFNDSYVAC